MGDGYCFNNAVGPIAAAMMDTERGYEGPPSPVGFDAQKRALMDLTAQGKGRIMPFFAYDPRSRSVAAVQAAIEQEGFVVVKLYPPLAALRQ